MNRLHKRRVKRKKILAKKLVAYNSRAGVAARAKQAADAAAEMVSRRKVLRETRRMVGR